MWNCINTFLYRRVIYFQKHVFIDENYIITNLKENARERLRCIQKIHPPPSLGEGPLRELFKEQEQGRYELRMKHVVEKEKLVLAVEQVSRYLTISIQKYKKCTRIICIIAIAITRSYITCRRF